MTATPPVARHDDACLAMLVRAPDPGTVKTRLGLGLPSDSVRQLYTCFVRDILATISRTGLVLRIFFSPPDATERVTAWLGGNHRYLPQQGRDLGERLGHAVEDCFGEGFRRVAVIGSDSPDLPGEFLLEAISALDSHDVAIGPATDGGYYLIGFRGRLFPGVFDDIPWGGPDVFTRTMERLRLGAAAAHVLAPWSDLDTVEDLRVFLARHRNDPPGSSRTLDYLRGIGEALE